MYYTDSKMTIKMNDTMIDIFFHFVVLAECFSVLFNLVDSSELLNHNPSQLLFLQQSNDVEELNRRRRQRESTLLKYGKLGATKKNGSPQRPIKKKKIKKR